MSNDETMIIRTKAEDAQLAKRRKRILGIPVAIAAPVAVALTAGGAAWAVMALTSDEAVANLDKGTVAQLKLTDAKFSGPLFPGGSTGLEFKVNNPNGFDATVKTIVISGSSTTTCNPAHLSGPVEVGTLNGLTVTLKTPVKVAAGSTETVKFPKALTLSAEATDSCSAVARFKVGAEGVAGN